LLLGSASGVLLRQSAESLAGRVSYLELSPLLWDEVQSSLLAPSSTHQAQLLAVQQYWLRGGMPLSLLAPTDAKSLRWRNDYLQSLVRRDLLALGITIPSETLWRFLRMLAHQHGQLFNASALAVAMTQSRQPLCRPAGSSISNPIASLNCQALVAAQRPLIIF
jgi:predicted AAA+ superfamily ATPase